MAGRNYEVKTNARESWKEITAEKLVGDWCHFYGTLHVAIKKKVCGCWIESRLFTTSADSLLTQSQGRRVRPTDMELSVEMIRSLNSDANLVRGLKRNLATFLEYVQIRMTCVDTSLTDGTNRIAFPSEPSEATTAVNGRPGEDSDDTFDRREKLTLSQKHLQACTERVLKKVPQSRSYIPDYVLTCCT